MNFLYTFLELYRRSNNAMSLEERDNYTYASRIQYAKKKTEINMKLQWELEYCRLLEWYSL